MTHKLPGSTLVETLVMMLVAGIVFLSVMEGMMTFSRLMAQRTQFLLAAGRQTNGYYRIASLVGRSDSLLASSTAGVELWQEGSPALLLLRDSMLIYTTRTFCDTLLFGVGSLQLFPGRGPSDTVTVDMGRGFTAHFTAEAPYRQYRTALDAIEKGYDNEE